MGGGGGGGGYWYFLLKGAVSEIFEQPEYICVVANLQIMLHFC